MTAIPFSKTLMSASLILTLAGCGDSSNVQMAQTHQDLDFSKAKVLHLPQTTGTVFDPEIAKQFNAIRRANDLEGTMTRLGGEATDYKLEIFKEVKEQLALLPMPEDIRTSFSADLNIAEEQAEKVYKHYAGKYSEGNLEKAYRHKYPDHFAKIDAAEQKVTDRAAYLKDAQEKYDQLSKQKKDKSDEIEAFDEKGTEVARQFFTENELAIPLTNTNFNAYSNTYLDRDATNCSSQNRYNAEHRVCYTIGFPNDGNGLRERDEKKLTKTQLQAFNTAIAPLLNEISKLAEEHAILTAQRNVAGNELNKIRVLADNQFGTERDLRRGVEEAKRSLNHASNGGYSSHSGIVDPGKNRYSPKHNRVFDEVAKGLGLYAIAPLTSFNVENAHKILQHLTKTTDDQLVQIEINKKGRFEIPVNKDNKPVDGVFLLSYVEKDGTNKIGEIRFGYKNDDGLFNGTINNPMRADSTLDYYLDRAGNYDLQLSNGHGFDTGTNLKAHIKKQGL